ARPAAARDQDRPTPDVLTGTWEGTLLFTSGHQARARLDLVATADGGLEGTYELTVQDEDQPGEPVRGRVALPSGVDATLLLVDGPRSTRWNGRVSPAGSHALAAFSGTFRGGAQDSGVFMLFRYKR